MGEINMVFNYADNLIRLLLFSLTFRLQTYGFSVICLIPVSPVSFLFLVYVFARLQSFRSADIVKHQK